MTENYRPGYGQYGPPPGPAPMPAPKKRTAPTWLIVVTGALIGLCCLGGGAVAVMSLADSGDQVTATPERSRPAPAEPAGGGEEESDDEQPSQMALQIGETGTYSEGGEEVGELTVESAERFTEPRSEFGEPPENDTFILVTVHAVAIGDDLYVVNPYDFHLRDSDGRRYEHFDGNALFAIDGSGLNHVELNPDEQVTGELVFDVPSGPMELVYAPGLGRALAFWEIPK